MSPRDEAFAASFVQHVAQNYLNRKVLLHEVYREMYPDDKNQRLMHDTCWGSLGTFINALSKAGECEAIKGPKGWVVRIDQDMLIDAEAEREEREGRTAPTEVDLDRLDEEEEEGIGEASCYLAQDDAVVPEVPDSRSKRMQASWAATLNVEPPPKRKKDDGGFRRAAALAREFKAPAVPDEVVEATATDRGKVTFQFGKTRNPKEFKESKESKLAPSPRSPFCWPPGLVVKVLCTETLKGKASGLKAVTLESETSMVRVRLLKPVDGICEEISVKSELLETVLPKLGGRVLVLGTDGKDENDPATTMEGILDSVQTESYSCTVQIGSCKVSGLPYERVCKIAA